jgi:hypothetical protein
VREVLEATSEATMKYFGYGAMAHPRIFRAVIGREVAGERAVLPGYHITTQRLEHIPDKARAVLDTVWPDNFRSYTIMRANSDDVVPIPGLIYEITEAEREIVSSWELIAEGWFCSVTVEAVLPNGEIVEAVTEVIGPGQLASGEYVDVSSGDLPLLNDFEHTVELAERHWEMLRMMS